VADSGPPARPIEAIFRGIACIAPTGGLLLRLDPRPCRSGIALIANRCDRSTEEDILTEGMNMTALGSTALSEGIKFLYSQAAEALKRWRERQDKPAREPSSHPTPPVFTENAGALAFHLDKVEALEEPLRKLMHSLADYASGTKPVNPGHSELMAAVHALRLAMEQVHQHALTFKGEQRGAGPGLIGSIGSLLSAAVALEAGQPRGEPAAAGRSDGSGEEPGLLGIRIGLRR
jgi:hypothetical protein